MLEFIKQPGVYEVVISLSSILLYKMFTSLFGVIDMYKYYRSLGHSSITLLFGVYVSAIEGLYYKKRFLKSAGLKEKHIEHLIKDDHKLIEGWKDKSIQKVCDFSPLIFKDLVEDLKKTD